MLNDSMSATRKSSTMRNAMLLLWGENACVCWLCWCVTCWCYLGVGIAIHIYTVLEHGGGGESSSSEVDIAYNPASTAMEVVELYRSICVRTNCIAHNSGIMEPIALIPRPHACATVQQACARRLLVVVLISWDISCLKRSILIAHFTLP